jgi:hypothetical protein
VNVHGDVNYISKSIFFLYYLEDMKTPLWLCILITVLFVPIGSVLLLAVLFIPVGGMNLGVVAICSGLSIIALSLLGFVIYCGSRELEVQIWKLRRFFRRNYAVPLLVA